MSSRPAGHPSFSFEKQEHLLCQLRIFEYCLSETLLMIFSSPHTFQLVAIVSCYFHLEGFLQLTHVGSFLQKIPGSLVQDWKDGLRLTKGELTLNHQPRLLQLPPSSFAWTPVSRCIRLFDTWGSRLLNSNFCFFMDMCTWLHFIFALMASITASSTLLPHVLSQCYISLFITFFFPHYSLFSSYLFPALWVPGLREPSHANH